MPSKLEIKRQSAERRMRCWELHLSGLNQDAIAIELGISQPRVSQLIKQAAQQHPINKLSIEERTAVTEGRWDRSERQILRQIAYQAEHGRTVTETLTLPDGSVQTKVTHQAGVDASLLRCLSNHHDRRNRHVLGQMSPDSANQQVQVNVIRDFIQQADGQGKLSSADWNQQQIVDADVR